MMNRMRKAAAILLSIAILITGVPLRVSAESADGAGITLEMLDAEARVCTSVQFQVTAPGADTYTVQWYDENGADLGSADYSLTDGVGTFGSWVDVPSTERIVVSTKIDGETYTDEMIVNYTSLGQFTGVTQITCQEMPVANMDYTVTWEAVEGASRYALYWDMPGTQYATVSQISATSYTMPAKYLPVEGDYCVRIAAIAPGYEMGEWVSMDLPVTETAVDERITISADATSVTCDDTVNITVSAPGAQGLQIYYLTNSNSWYESASGESHAFQVTCMEDMTVYAKALYDGTWVVSDSIAIDVSYLGTISAPVVTAPENLTAGAELTASWDSQENIQRYVVDICTADGTVLERLFPGTATSLTHPMIYPAGTYSVRVQAEGAQGWDNRNAVTTRTLELTGALQQGPVVTMSTTTALVDDTVTGTVEMAGLQRIAVKWLDWGLVAYFNAENNKAEFNRIMNHTGSFQAKVSALVDGVWTDWSEIPSVNVTNLGQLDKAVVTVAESFAAGQSVAASWSAVENAESYTVVIYDQTDNAIDSCTVDASVTAYTFDGLLDAGDYYIQVIAYGTGWEQSRSEKASFSVTGELAAGPAVAVDSNEVIKNEQFTVTVSMEGATAFRIRRDNVITEHAAENGMLSVTLPLNGDVGDVIAVSACACVDGIWTAYGPEQTITILDIPMLDQVEITLPEEARAGEDFTVSWTTVENASSYRVKVFGAAEEAVWERTFYDETNSVVFEAGDWKQGSYRVAVTASPYSSNYRASTAEAALEVLAPLSGKEYDYFISSSGAYLYGYLGVPVPAEIRIPDTIEGAAVTYIGTKCFANEGTLTKVTIPASVTYISKDAFDGSTNLTICGYTGSKAEEFAIVNGYAFVALDDGEGDISASWETPLLVNQAATIFVAAAGATEVRVYLDGTRDYRNTIVLTESGASITWKPDSTKTYCLRFEALVGGTWLTSKNYSVTPTTLGTMPQAQGLTVSASVIEPGTEVTLSWSNPEGATALRYTAGIQDPDMDYVSWSGYVAAGDTSCTFQDYEFDEEGVYTLWVRTESETGMLPATVSITLEVKSTQLWDCIPSEKKVIAYHGTDTAVEIPAQIGSNTITYVGESIFEDSNLTSATVADGITTIGYYAFRNSDALTTVTLPTSLTRIYGYAFYDCDSLHSVTLPESLTSILSLAFYSCDSLTSISIPSKVKSLSDSLFYNCRSLAQVNLPENLTSIGSATFAYCTSLKSITIPQGVSSIASDAFKGCTGLTIYGYSGSQAESFAQAQGFDFVALDSAVTGDISFQLEKTQVYTGGYIRVSVTAPEAEKLRLDVGGSVTEHTVSGGQATLSRSVSKAGSYDVTVSQYVDGQWLASCEKQRVTVVDLEAPVIEMIPATPAYTPVTVRWKHITDVAYYSMNVYIDNVGVANYSNITAVDADGYAYQQIAGDKLCDEGVYTIIVQAYATDGGKANGERTFQITGIEDAFVYEVKTDGTARVTNYTASADRVEVPEQLDGYIVTEIGGNAFRNSAVTAVTLPATITEIAGGAFAGCTTLRTVSVPDARATIRSGAFAGCSSLESITVGPGIYPEADAFKDCRTDTVVYGYAGGRVEAIAKSNCTFSSLGQLADGPVITAEDIWQSESLSYSVAKAGAEVYEIEVTYPDGSVQYTLYTGQRFETTVDDFDFTALTEDSLVSIRAAALVAGAWTEYSQETVDVFVSKTLDAPVLPEIGTLQRHVTNTISWEPVENAECYQLVISRGEDMCLEQTVTDTSFTLKPGDLDEGDDYTLTVTAKAERYLDASATGRFAVEMLRLAAPSVTLDAQVIRHMGTEISWEPVENAQRYLITLSRDGAQPYYLYSNYATEQTSLTLPPEKLEPGNYTFAISAQANYCHSSDTVTKTFTVYQQQLETPTLTLKASVPRHEGTELRWSQVADAQFYILTVIRTDENGTHTLYDARKVSETFVKLTPNQLEPGEYQVSVTACAPYFTDSEMAAGEFESYMEKLAAPTVTGPEMVLGGDTLEIIVGSVTDAEEYLVALYDTNGQWLTAQEYRYCPGEWTYGLDYTIPEGELTLRVTVSGYYREDGVTEITIPCKPLFTYRLENGTAVITGYNGTDEKVHIPEKLDGYAVTALGDSVFEGDTSVRMVYLPDSVTVVGAAAFKNCTSLETFVGQGVEEIGAEAFYNCSALRTLMLGKQPVRAKEDAFPREFLLGGTLLLHDNVMNIEISQPGNYAEAINLGSVTYREGIVEIPAQAHYRNLILAKVKLPRSLRSIGSEAFAQCPVLEEVVIYDTVETLAEDVFADSPDVRLHIKTSDMDAVSYIEQYAIDHDIPYIKSYEPAEQTEQIPVTDAYYEDNVPDKDQYANASLKTAYLADTAKEIGSQAFAQCANLLDVRLHEDVTAIAEDAFEGSGRVRLWIHVYDMDTVCYAEQYAIDHNIPYIKQKREFKVADVIKLSGGTEETLYVRVDVPARIELTDIPGEADYVILYLDGEPIYAGSEDKVWNTGLEYTFRTLGEHTLTAQAYADGSVIEESWIRPVKVVGIQLKADREWAWTGERVTFTVSMESSQSYATLYADGMEIGTMDIKEGTGTFAYAFTQAGDRQIFARTEDGESSAPLNLQIRCIGQLAQPVLEAESIQCVSEGIRCGWTATANTDGYVLRVLAADGTELVRRDISDDGSADYSCTIPAADLPGEGTYTLYLMNYGYQYDQNESETVAVRLVPAGIPGFSMDKQSVSTGEPVNFEFYAFGASKMELWVDGEVVETVELTDGRAMFARPFTKSGDRALTVRAWTGQEWTEFAPGQILTVTSIGQLAAVEVTAAAHQLLGNAITASWKQVANADRYTVYFRSAAHETLWTMTTDQLSVSVPGELVTQMGGYYFLVMASGTGYDQSEGSVAVTVSDRLPGPVIEIPEAGQELTGISTQLRWQPVAGAAGYVVSLARKNADGVYEKVWAAPNEVVNVGSVLNYSLTDLVYGGEYRVAVGTVTRLEDGTERIGWTERLFCVTMPQLTLSLTADPASPYENQQMTLRAVVNHALTTAVLTDETGAVAEVVFSDNQVVEGNRIFTFVLTQPKQCQKTYTVTVSGTDALETVQRVAQTVTVQWLDANAPAVTDVVMTPENIWPNMDAEFTIRANMHTTMVDVYRVEGEMVTLLTTLRSASADAQGSTFRYVCRFAEEGDHTLRFVPVNKDGEWSKGYEETYAVLPKGKMPAPNVTNLAAGDIVLDSGYAVKWDAISLPTGMVFGGYSVTLYSWDTATDWWQAMPGQYNVFLDTDLSYTLPALKEGSRYRIEVYTLEDGQTVPSEQFSGCTWIEFGYRTIPEFTVTAIENEGIIRSSATVHWNAPVWRLAPDRKPDGYQVCWFLRDSQTGDRTEIHRQELTGDQLSVTLPGDLTNMPGKYEVEVYARLGTVEAMGTGENTFSIEAPDVAIYKPDAFATWLNGMPLEVQGSVKGGVMHVLIRLVDTSGNVLNLKADDGSVVSHLLVAVVQGGFSANLNPADPLVPSVGNLTDHAVEVFGYMKAEDVDSGAYVDSDWWMVDVDDAELTGFTVNGFAGGYWLFHDETAVVRVNANQLVAGLTLYDNGAPVRETFTAADQADGSRHFATGNFSLIGEGLHVMRVCDAANEALFRSMDVYVVTRTEDAQMYANDSVILRSMPEGKGGAVTTVNENSTIIRKGTCGDYLMVVVDGQYKGFVHKSEVREKDTYVITYPTTGTVIDLRQTDAVEIRWETYPEAVSYRVTLRWSIRTSRGTLAVISLPKTVQAVQSDTQSVVFTSLEILDEVSSMRSFKDTQWDVTIVIEAYGE